MKIALWSAQFFKFVYFTCHSHVTEADSQSNCFISGMCGPPSFHLMFIFLQMEPKSVVHLVFLSFKNWADHLAFFMPYLSDLLPFIVIFERML